MQYENRISEIQRSFREAGLDAVLVSELSNIRYLTGFTGSNALLLITARSAVFFSDVRYRVQAEKEVSFCRRIIVSGTSLSEQAAKVIRQRNIQAVGMELQHLSYNAAVRFRKSIRPVRIQDASGLVSLFRVVKSGPELAHIKKAAAITEHVFQQILHFVKPGVTEIDLAAEISHRLRQLGADGDAFDPIVLFGQRSALIHGRPTQKKLTGKGLVLFDFGCKVDGYCSDLSRTVAVGRIPRRLSDAYQSVREAQQEALQTLRAGMRAVELDAAARNTLRKHGLGKYFEHALGHGIGLDIHEAPMISPKSTHILQKGSVFTIEPGVYIPGLGGIRIESDVHLGERGAELLTTSTTELVTL